MRRPWRAALLETPHPHLWQQQPAALALALPRLLPANEPGARSVATGLLQQAHGRSAHRGGGFHDRALSGRRAHLPPGRNGRRLDGIPAGGRLEVDVTGEEVVRLVHRGATRPARAAALRARLEVGFDAQGSAAVVAGPRAPRSRRARGFARAPARAAGAGRGAPAAPAGDRRPGARVDDRGARQGHSRRAVHAARPGRRVGGSQRQGRVGRGPGRGRARPGGRSPGGNPRPLSRQRCWR